MRSKLGLSFRATRDFFRHENLRLRCAASLTLVYELKAVEYLIDGSKKVKASSKRYTSGMFNLAFFLCHLTENCLYHRISTNQQ